MLVGYQNVHTVETTSYTCPRRSPKDRPGTSWTPGRTSGGSGVIQIVIALKLEVQGAALRQPNPVIRVQSEELLGSLAHLTP